MAYIPQAYPLWALHGNGEQHRVVGWRSPVRDDDGVQAWDPVVVIQAGVLTCSDTDYVEYHQ